VKALGNMILNGDNCPSCFSRSIKYRVRLASDLVGKALISVYECKLCGLAWQYPPLRTSEESKAYFSDQYQAAAENTYFDRTNRRKVAEMELDFICTISPAFGRLLDIGAGDGTFISAAADIGWQSIGLDPARNTKFTYNQRGQGTAVLVQELDSLARAQSFDVITMWDVIEHVERPLEILEFASGLLSDKGVLVLETGNYQSVDRIEGANAWWGYQADHRWYFSPATLLPMLKQMGLRHSVIATRVLRPWWKGRADYSGPRVLRTAKQVCRFPLRAADPIRQHRDLRRAAKDWRETAGLSIFTIGVSRNPIPAKAGTDFLELT
jgi:2-polyprenyl-3-methyl-5-hydroxy-6-metoxy-1,4-benzoquinol methylase